MEKKTCEYCKGTGKVDAVTMHGVIRVTCHECLGEVFITDDLLRRKQLGADLKKLRLKFQLTTREAAAGYGCTLTKWSDIERGQYDLKKIQDCLFFLRNLTADWEVKTEHILYALTSPDAWHYGDELFRSENLMEVEAVKDSYRGRMHNGLMAVYEIREKVTVVK